MPEVVVAELVVESGGTIRCFRCHQFIGETDDAIEFIGVGRGKEFTDMAAGPKRTMKCKCGWINVYRKR